MNINPYNANDVVYNDKKLIQVSDMSEFLTFLNSETREFKVRGKIISKKSFQRAANLRKIYIPSTCLTIEAKTPQDAPFYGCSPYLVIFTDLQDNEIPSTWGPYWNYYSDSETLLVYYGSSMSRYKNAAMHD